MTLGQPEGACCPDKRQQFARRNAAKTAQCVALRQCAATGGRIAIWRILQNRHSSVKRIEPSCDRLSARETGSNGRIAINVRQPFLWSYYTPVLCICHYEYIFISIHICSHCTIYSTSAACALCDVLNVYAQFCINGAYWYIDITVQYARRFKNLAIIRYGSIMKCWWNVDNCSVDFAEL